MKKVTPRAEVELRLCQSRKTKKLYYGLFDKNDPVKFWSAGEMTPTSIDLIMELVSAYDLGYDVKFQFPKTDKQGTKKLVPQIMDIEEPEERSSNGAE